MLERHLPDLRVFIRARSGKKLRAKESHSDLVRTVCREALGALGQFQWQGEGSFRHWLFTVALNKIQGKANFYGAAMRDAEREQPQVADTDHDERGLLDAYQGMFGPSQFAIANGAIANFEAALDEVPEQYREVILLSHVVGMSDAEIAEKLGKTEGERSRRRDSPTARRRVEFLELHEDVRAVHSAAAVALPSPDWRRMSRATRCSPG